MFQISDEELQGLREEGLKEEHAQWTEGKRSHFSGFYEWYNLSSSI